MTTSTPIHIFFIFFSFILINCGTNKTKQNLLSEYFGGTFTGQMHNIRPLRGRKTEEFLHFSTIFNKD